ncbi:MAG: hypothetical protein ABIN67_05145 [Ferruginibacter sp.]
METIIIEPKDKKELAFVSEFLERTKIKATIKKKKKVAGDDNKTKKEILDSIERGYKEAQLHAAGKLKLNTLKEFLDEL